MNMETGFGLLEVEVVLAIKHIVSRDRFCLLRPFLKRHRLQQRKVSKSAIVGITVSKLQSIMRINNRIGAPKRAKNQKDTAKYGCVLFAYRVPGGGIAHLENTQQTE